MSMMSDTSSESTAAHVTPACPFSLGRHQHRTPSESWYHLVTSHHAVLVAVTIDGFIQIFGTKQNTTSIITTIQSGSGRPSHAAHLVLTAAPPYTFMSPRLTAPAFLVDMHVPAMRPVAGEMTVTLSSANIVGLLLLLLLLAPATVETPPPPPPPLL